MNRKGLLILASLGVGAAICLAWIGLTDYAVFHLIIELTGIAICVSVFTIGWNTRHITNQDHFPIMGSGYLGCAVLEFLHMLSHIQTPFLGFSSPNVAVHFWLAARTIVAVSFLHALYVKEWKAKVNQELILAAYGLAAVGAALAITFSAAGAERYFIPALQWPQQMLWRMAINAAVLVGFWRLLRSVDSIQPYNKGFLVAIVLSEVAGQVAFTLQPDLVGVASVLGHLFKILTRICVYRVLVISTLQDPYNTLFQDLTEAVLIMRAQRHDIINDLTLASTYLQMNRIPEAQQCIEVIAADMSDRYNYATLPKDAWCQIINAKWDIARSRGVRFNCKMEAPLPDDFHQRRLLPKLVGNLLDNALDAVAGTPDPWISLEWSRTQDGSVLRISNNGSEIPPELRTKLFDPGLSTKGIDRGFGLTICRKIANELGGSLRVESNAQTTTFTLILPQGGMEKAAGKGRH